MRIIPILGIVFTLAACGDDGVRPSPVSAIPGTYELTAVDGQVLPFLLLDLGAYRAKLASATLELSADGTYEFEFGIRIEDSGNLRTETQTDAGHWTANDNAITLTSTEGSITRTGTVSGSLMTLESSAREFRLAKRRQ